MASSAAACVLGFTTTVLVVATPLLVFGYDNRSLHLVLETVNGCAALVVAYLVYGRFVRSRRVQDLLLLQGLVLLATASLGLLVVVRLVEGELAAGVLNTWLPLAIRVAGVLFIAAAAVLGTGQVAWPGWRTWTLAPAFTIGTGLFTVLLLLHPLLPAGTDPAVAPDVSIKPMSVGHPALIGAQLVGFVGFLIAGVAFTAQARLRQDELIRWLGPGCFLAAFAWLNYALFPSVFSDWLYTGDFLRSGFYLLLFVGAAREIRQYWVSQATLAVIEDRRRLARELHDGVLQELGYIRSESAALPSLGGGGADRIIKSCDRALDEARQAVDAMGRPADEPLGFVLHRGAVQVTERYGLALELDLDDSVTVNAEQRHALVRIVREAVGNAARHGRAERVGMTLTQDGGSRSLIICDDGSGFDIETASRAASGFGLISMRERAEGLPGSFFIHSSPVEGTTVTVQW